MEINKNYLQQKYTINNLGKPAIQIQNFFRVDHNIKHINLNKFDSKKNPASYQYELYYSSRSKSKERESETSYINKPKMLFKNLPPEFNLDSQNENNPKLINNFILAKKKDPKIKISNKTSSSINIHCSSNNNKLNFTTNETLHNNKSTLKKGNSNYFKTEGSEFENETTKENTKNKGFKNNFTSTGFKTVNLYNIKNAGKTIIKYEINNKSNLSKIDEILTKNKDKKYTIKERKDIKNISKNKIKPIKVNNNGANFKCQRKVVPPIMNKLDKKIFENESLFSIKKSQNNIMYKNPELLNNKMAEQSGKTFTNFKNEIKTNFDDERRSIQIKNINHSKPKANSRLGSEDNQKMKILTINNTSNNNTNNKIKKTIEEFMSIKKMPNNLNEGIFYRSFHGYKFYFDLSNIDCYLFKEINDKINMVESILDYWNRNYGQCENYLKILGIKIYESNYEIIIEYPNGGENFYDIISSIGFYDVKLLLNISQIIYNCLSKIKNDEYNSNILFCLCDIYLNENNHIKIIPPFIRKINDKEAECKCKYSIYRTMAVLNYNINNISLLCFGFLLLQLITQNLLFKLNSYNYLMNFENKNNILKYKNCCLLHTLLNIESDLFNQYNELLLKSFINLYPECVSDYIHICTQFNNSDTNYDILHNHEFLNMYDANNHIEIYLKELLSVVTLDKEYNKIIISFEEFLEKFESIYKRLNIDKYIFDKIIRHKKILNSLIRAFNLTKNSDSDKLYKLIRIKDI
jgi:hypothetical protein